MSRNLHTEPLPFYLMPFLMLIHVARSDFDPDILHKEGEYWEFITDLDDFDPTDKVHIYELTLMAYCNIYYIYIFAECLLFRDRRKQCQRSMVENS